MNPDLCILYSDSYCTLIIVLELLGSCSVQQRKIRLCENFLRIFPFAVSLGKLIDWKMGWLAVGKKAGSLPETFGIKSHAILRDHG